jgi:hypothetical protein
VTPARIRQFWEWFRARAEKVREDPGLHEEEISEMLDRLHPGLAWEMGGPREGPQDFVVRSDSADLRYRTHEIVRAAPPLDGWRFSSWRLAVPVAGFCIQVNEDRVFELSNFSADLSEDETYPFLHLVVASPEFSDPPADQERYAATLALDSILGEKTVEDAIESVEFRRGPRGAIAAELLSDEVARRMASLRERSRPARSDEWAMMEGEREGKPLLALVAMGFGSTLPGGFPWRVDVAVTLRDPFPNGIASSEELLALRPVEDRLIGRLEAGKRGAVWSHWTHDGERVTSGYVGDPSGLSEDLLALVREAGFEATVTVVYDPRWRLYRGFVP